MARLGAHAFEGRTLTQPGGSLNEDFIVSKKKPAKFIVENVLRLAAAKIKIGDQVTGNRIPWVMYPSQVDTLRKLATGEDTIILKIRQCGTTTLGIFYCLMRAISEPDLNVAIVANNYATATKLREDLDKFIQCLDLKLKRATQRKITLENNSSFVCLTAGSGSIGRGSTFGLILCSEAGFYENSYKAMSALLPSLTSTGQLILESTATPTDTHFRSVWESNQASFQKIFLGVEGHRNYVESEHLIDDDTWEYLKKKYNFTSRRHGAWWWKRVSASGDENGGIREYPVLPEQAFLSAEGVWIEKVPRIASYILDEKDSNIRLYHKPERGKRYVMSIDTASGGGGTCDDSVCIVYNITDDRIDASICSNVIKVDTFAELSHYLYKKYGCEQVFIEKNGIGEAMLAHCTSLKMAVIRIHSTVKDVYEGMLWAKRKIEKENGLCADENLKNNCLSCRVLPPKTGTNNDKNRTGSFVGKKDFLMAIAFIGSNTKYWMRDNPPPPQPYLNPQTHFPGLPKKKSKDAKLFK